jgi:hypothetical protein
MVIVQVDEYHPRRILCGSVIPADSLLQKRFALLTVYGSKVRSYKNDEPAHDRFIDYALYRSGNSDAIGHP